MNVTRVPVVTFTLINPPKCLFIKTTENLEVIGPVKSENLTVRGSKTRNGRRGLVYGQRYRSISDYNEVSVVGIKNHFTRMYVGTGVSMI